MGVQSQTRRHQQYCQIQGQTTFRVLSVVAAFYNPNIDQMDDKTASFYDPTDQPTCAEMPKGIKTEANKDMVCKLLKSVYGLK